MNIKTKFKVLSFVCFVLGFVIVIRVFNKMPVWVVLRRTE